MSAPPQNPSQTQQQSRPEEDESSLIAARKDKLKRWRDELGVDPYGRRVEGLIPLAEARAMFDAAAHEEYARSQDAARENPGAAAIADRRPRARVAGRCVQHRLMGKLVFLVLRDHTGDLQISISKSDLDATSFKIASKLDYGDIVVAEGPVGATQKGEICIWADRFEVHCKSLVPPPEKWRGLTDPELRYRQRYVDMYANPETIRTLQLRSRIVAEVRRFMESRGFLEVETPMMQPIPGGAAARPFVTHHNALDIDLYLRIAPELYLKRLLVGGFNKVFELNRSFRNEGISPRHNPEFTMLEAYAAFGSWETMAELVEEMICTVAQNLFGSLTIEHKNEAGEVTRRINLTRPWRRVRMVDLIAESTEQLGFKWEFTKQRLQETPELYERLLDHHKEEFSLELDARRTKAGEASGRPYDAAKKWRDWQENQYDSMTAPEQLVAVYEKLIEPTLIDPCFVTHVPSVNIPLARENADDPYFADVYELAINGVEISPGYTELNDPDVQERHFRHQIGDKDEQQPIDEDFLRALRVGMPPAGGMGLGIDRLVMMLTGVESIRDVILFPLLRPQDSPGASKAAES